MTDLRNDDSEELARGDYEYDAWKDRQLLAERKEHPERFRRTVPYQVATMSHNALDGALDGAIAQLSRSHQWPSRLKDLRTESRRRNQP